MIAKHLKKINDTEVCFALLLCIVSCTGGKFWYHKHLKIRQVHLSYRKKTESFQVKYGTWQMGLRPDYCGRFNDSQWAGSSVG